MYPSVSPLKITPEQEFSGSLQNGTVERFNRTYREEVLDCYVFETLEKCAERRPTWIVRYNEQRPHEALGNLTRDNT